MKEMPRGRLAEARLVERGWLREPALHNHPRAVTCAAVTGRAVDVEPFTASLQQRSARLLYLGGRKLERLGRVESLHRDDVHELAVDHPRVESRIHPKLAARDRAGLER